MKLWHIFAVSEIGFFPVHQSALKFVLLKLSAPMKVKLSKYVKPTDNVEKLKKDWLKAVKIVEKSTEQHDLKLERTIKKYIYNYGNSEAVVKFSHLGTYYRRVLSLIRWAHRFKKIENWMVVYYGWTMWVFLTKNSDSSVYFIVLNKLFISIPQERNMFMPISSIPAKFVLTLESLISFSKICLTYKKVIPRKAQNFKSLVAKCWSIAAYYFHHYFHHFTHSIIHKTDSFLWVKKE